MKLFNEAYLGNFQYKQPSDPYLIMMDYYFFTFVNSNTGKGEEDWNIGVDEETLISIRDARNDCINFLYPHMKEAMKFSLSCEARHFFDQHTEENLEAVSELSEGTLKQFMATYGALFFSEYSSSSFLRKYKDIILNAENPYEEIDNMLTPRERKLLSSKDEGIRISNFKKIKATQKKIGISDSELATIFMWIYETSCMNPGFGGKAWYGIAKGYKNLLSVENKDESLKMIWIDHCYDLQHNTDTVFNKIRKYAKKSDSGNYSWIGKALEWKKWVIKDPIDFYGVVSPQLKPIVSFVDSHFYSDKKDFYPLFAYINDTTKTKKWKLEFSAFSKKLDKYIFVCKTYDDYELYSMDSNNLKMVNHFDFSNPSDIIGRVDFQFGLKLKNKKEFLKFFEEVRIDNLTEFIPEDFEISDPKISWKFEIGQKIEITDDTGPFAVELKKGTVGTIASLKHDYDAIGVSFFDIGFTKGHDLDGDLKGKESNSGQWIEPKYLKTSITKIPYSSKTSSEVASVAGFKIGDVVEILPSGNHVTPKGLKAGDKGIVIDFSDIFLGVDFAQSGYDSGHSVGGKASNPLSGYFIDAKYFKKVSGINSNGEDKDLEHRFLELAKAIGAHGKKFIYIAKIKGYPGVGYVWLYKYLGNCTSGVTWVKDADVKIPGDWYGELFFKQLKMNIPEAKEKFKKSITDMGYSIKKVYKASDMANITTTPGIRTDSFDLGKQSSKKTPTRQKWDSVHDNDFSSIIIYPDIVFGIRVETTTKEVFYLRVGKKGEVYYYDIYDCMTAFFKGTTSAEFNYEAIKIVLNTFLGSGWLPKKVFLDTLNMTKDVIDKLKDKQVQQLPESDVNFVKAVKKEKTALFAAKVINNKKEAMYVIMHGSFSYDFYTLTLDHIKGGEEFSADNALLSIKNKMKTYFGIPYKFKKIFLNKTSFQKRMPHSKKDK